MQKNDKSELLPLKSFKCVLFSLLCLIVAAAGTGTANGQSTQRVTVNLTGANIKALFSDIRDQTSYNFVYSDDQMDRLRPITVDMADATVNHVLDVVLSGTPYTYSIEGNTIAIIARTTADQTSYAVISGRVTDQNGNPLPGVSVVVRGTTIGVSTDVNGEYQLRFPVRPNTVIVYSFIGKQTVELNYTGEDRVDITLDDLSVGISDVVVIGYGTKSARNLTSSVSSLRADEMEKYSNGSTSLDNMIGGAIKGVRVSQSTGKPGDGAKINIRGITSPLSASGATFGTNEPLYVIDGVPFFLERSADAINPLLSISPGDIESIDVLKDAAATSIYGSRGANGVVIVNTKTGLRNEPIRITAGYSISIGNPVKKYKPLDTDEFKTHHARMLTNLVDAYNRGNITEGDLYSIPGIGNPYDWPTMPNFGIKWDWEDPEWMEGLRGISFDKLNEDAFGKANTNWVNEVENRNALTHQYNFGIRGGGEKTNFMFSFNAVNQEGMMINDRMDRYGARLHIDTDISKRFRGGASLNYSYSKRRLGEDLSFMGITKEWITRPDSPVYNEDGSFARVDASPGYGIPFYEANPVARRERKNESGSNQFTGSSYLEYRVLKGLKVRGDVNISMFDTKGSVFSPTIAVADLTEIGSPLEATLDESLSKVTYTSINFRADYEWNCHGHSLNAMAGVGFDRSFYENSGGYYMDFPDDDILTNISSAARISSYSGGKSKSGLNSIYARVSYSYLGKYLAEVNFRSDVSSKFGPGNKRAYFPSLSLGWRLSDENFMAQARNVDDLKIRASIGTTGSTNVADFSYRQFFDRNSSSLYGGNSAVTLNSNFPNRNVKWEKTTEYNLGVDFAFFGHRLYGSIDAYYRYTSGALAPSPIAFETGSSSFYSNLMDLSNKGVEIEVGGDIIRNGDWRWNVDMNLSLNRNILENLNNANINSYVSSYYTEGKPVGTLWGYRVEKIFQSDEEVAELNRIAAERNPGVNYYYSQYTGAGDYKFIDKNGDGRITADDRYVLTTPEPKFFGGFSTTLSYKSLSLSAAFQYTVGVKSLLSELQTNAGGMIGSNLYRELYGNYWTPDNTGAHYARMMGMDFSRNSTTSDRYVYDSSYLRLKNLSIGYNLPQKFLSKFNVSSVQLYVNFTNLWTITKWPGLDPELINNYTAAFETENEDPYPLSKTIMFGVRFEF